MPRIWDAEVRYEGSRYNRIEASPHHVDFFELVVGVSGRISCLGHVVLSNLGEPSSNESGKVTEVHPGSGKICFSVHLHDAQKFEDMWVIQRGPNGRLLL